MIRRASLGESFPNLDQVLLARLRILGRAQIATGPCVSRSFNPVWLPDKRKARQKALFQKCLVDSGSRYDNAGRMKLFCGPVLLWFALSVVRLDAAICLSNDGYQVFPGDNIQDALQQAAENKTNKIVKVHAGEYRPNSKRQALIWFNKTHDGIRLEAEGLVTLSAANLHLADPSEPGFPAIVNHVVYFGDGISSNTVLKGFRITGANHFVTKNSTSQMEPNTTIPKNFFFFADGGAIKVFGRSYPTIEQIEVVDNFTSPCGAGISVQHQGFNQQPVAIENCVFLRNRTQVTGAAIDLLAGSSARIINCLFVGNVSNTGEDVVAKQSGERPFANNGVVTIFRNSLAMASMIWGAKAATPIASSQTTIWTPG